MARRRFALKPRAPEEGLAAVVGQEDWVSTVLSYDEGIHWVGNPGKSMAISVHLYGPWVGEIDGRDYDRSRDYVCDRVVARRCEESWPAR